MLNFLFLVLLSLTSSCGRPHEEAGSSNDLSALQARRDEIVGREEAVLAFDERCDGLTFKSLWSSFVTRQNLKPYEWRAGEWHRDGEACYPEASKSEISFDGLMGVMLHAQTWRDKYLVDRIARYGAENNWVMGEGYQDLVYVPQLWYITKVFHDGDSAGIPIPDLFDSKLSGYRGYLAAEWVLYMGRLNGALSSGELRLLKRILAANPQNWLAYVTLHRYTDGDYSQLVTASADWPKGVGSFGWGSCPDELLLAVVTGIAEGR